MDPNNFPQAGDSPCPLFDSAFDRILVAHPRPELVYHYTSAPACISIIGYPTKKPAIRASNAFATNDREEVSHGVGLIEEMAADYATAAALQRALTLHYKYGDRHNLLRREACFASFCAEGDLLSQWRAYGRDGQGYAIGFSADALSDAGKPHNFRLMPAIYDRAEQRQILKGLFEEAANVISSPDRLSEYYRARGGTDAEGSSRPRQLQGHDLDMFWARLIHQAVKIALTFKHGGFNEEQEWRLVSEYPLRRAWWFIAAERGVIPYREIEFPESCIRELWLGPALDQDLNEKMLDLFIEHGCKAKPAIHRSAIPFRGL